MTEEQKKIIQQLRAEGNGYKKIAEQTGISVNSVKTFCRRNALTVTAMNTRGECLYCGKPLIQNPGHREKKFCSSACRTRWWSKHRNEQIHKKEHYLTCAHCGKKFTAYCEPGRKYCCHACYIADRFGGGTRE